MNGIIPRLKDRLEDMGGAAICYSGGLDSTVILRNAAGLERGSVVAVMVDMPLLSERQRVAARRVADRIGIPLEVIRIGWEDITEVTENTDERCYHCKKLIYRIIRDRAAELGLEHVVAGENADDLDEERPGMRAGREAGILNPLSDLGIGRREVMDAVNEMDLPAVMVKETCLATRFPLNTPVSEGNIRMAEECEEAIRSIAGIQQIRIRFDKGKAVVLGGSDETERLMMNAGSVADILRSKGFSDVRIDQEGYRRQ